ncbi:zinc finger protein 41 [Parasteatoda tepidariorum]|uniref:zinc finger protein 41 n=1 Tax=Parasteatoda tepidariorum TaxID=114398 RepID=UPI00077F96FD|nr:zinc finger protein 2 homolog [Parasteatoda tepidariorum]
MYHQTFQNAYQNYFWSHSDFTTAKYNLSSENVENRGKTEIWRPFETQHLSINKLNHSTSSVFVPVKKKFCSKCSAVFYSNLQLIAHMQVHTGSKPFACDDPNCSKSFARNEELTRHRRIHSGYKPHHCNSCGKCFGRKDHLSKHLKTHLQVSEKKVYVCRMCGHRYTRSDALTRHRSNAHAISKTVVKIEN